MALEGHGFLISALRIKCSRQIHFLAFNNSYTVHQGRNPLVNKTFKLLALGQLCFDRQADNKQENKLIKKVILDNHKGYI